MRIIAFDVNETLLDLRGLDPHFETLLGSASARPLWFAQMLQLSFVGGLTGEYVDFTTAQLAALRMVGARTGAQVSDEDATEMVERMSHLAPHPEVAAALERLTDNGFTSVALTNSVQEVAEAQLNNAGIRSSFDRVISADSVRHLKPAPEPYRSVADAYDVEIGDVTLVAAHAWDVSGALAAGCRAAFVARVGIVPSPIGAQPQIVGDDLDSVVSQLIAAER